MDGQLDEWMDSIQVRDELEIIRDGGGLMPEAVKQLELFPVGWMDEERDERMDKNRLIEEVHGEWITT